MLECRKPRTCSPMATPYPYVKMRNPNQGVIVMLDWAQVARTIEERLKLDSAPVAVKMVASTEDPPLGLIQNTKVLSFCQFVAAAATGGYPFWMDRHNLGCTSGRIAFGLYDPSLREPLLEKAIKTTLGMYAPDSETARRNIAARPAIPPGQLKGVAIAPLSKARFEPDALLILVTPWQAYFAIDDYLYASREATLSLEIGTNSLICAYGAVRAGHLDKIALTTACSGGRVYAGIERTQMVIAFPKTKLEALVEGMHQRARTAPYPGMVAMPAPIPMPPKHILTREVER